MTEIQHDPESHRFHALVDGEQAVLEYERADGCMVITHTRVPEAIAGRGVASRLTRAAFETAREDGLQVHPQCPYAAAWVERHPEYRSMLR